MRTRSLPQSDGCRLNPKETDQSWDALIPGEKYRLGLMVNVFGKCKTQQAITWDQYYSLGLMEPNYLVSGIKRTGMSHSSWRRAGFKTTFKMLPYWAWKQQELLPRPNNVFRRFQNRSGLGFTTSLLLLRSQKVSWNQGEAWSFVKSRKMCMVRVTVCIGASVRIET